MRPFVGPSYDLPTKKADVQRAINLILRRVESGQGKPDSQFFLEPLPGYTAFSTLGGEIRGAWNVSGRCFFVAGASLYELTSTGIATSRGSLATAIGPVDMADGLSQLVIVDGLNGYTLNLSTNVFAQITDPDFQGSFRVAFLDNYFLFIRPDTQQFYISALDDASTHDALDFASAEGSPDDLVAVVSDHREAWLLGDLTTEVWFNSGNVDFPFERNQGAFIEIGCAAKHSAQKIDNTVFWIGKDKNGEGIVYAATGYQPQRISTTVVERALQGSTNLANARAFCMQYEGLTLYWINAPGLSTGWVYEVSSGSWFEAAELVAGLLTPHKATCHVYAFGFHLFGADDGTVYKFSKALKTHNGAAMYRERTSPHSARPDLLPVEYGTFVLDCTVGKANQGEDPQVELCWSDDGGETWGNWLARPLGKVGKYTERVEWHRTGQATDRVWKLRCTADVEFSVINVSV